MLTKSELQMAVLLLRHATGNVQWASTLFFGVGDSATSARLKDIVARLTDEVKAIDALIPSAPDQGGRA